tara:strand:- start:264 stop:998 length:735 start_codon:yes stop_codon:yes gene_type:complete
MRYTGNYVIHTTKQLIDINQSINNFKALISIECDNEDDILDIVIVTQEELDNEQFEFNYKQIQHKVNIEMEPENQDDIQNYLLVLKSDKKVSASITIDVTDLDNNNFEETNDNETEDQLVKPKINNVKKANKKEETNLVSSFLPKNLFCKKNLIYLIIIVFIGYLIYNFCFKKSKNNENNNNIDNVDNTYSQSSPISTETININDLTLDNSSPQECSNVENIVPSQSQSSSVLASLRKLRTKKK